MGRDQMTAYTKNTWLERAMDTAAKKAALNNLENMYTDDVYYISNTLLHSTEYYTDAQAAARYYTAVNDGAGSGLIAETVDSHTAADIKAYGVPSGVIAVWSGASDAIPTGWLLCDGAGGLTPDLRSKFIVGAGTSYALNDKTTDTTATPTASDVTIGTTALIATTLPAHTHTYTDDYRDNRTSNQGSSGITQLTDHTNAYSTTDDGASTEHGHPGSTFTGAPVSIIPAYLVLCFIMKD